MSLLMEPLNLRTSLARNHHIHSFANVDTEIIGWSKQFQPHNNKCKVLYQIGAKDYFTVCQHNNQLHYAVIRIKDILKKAFQNIPTPTSDANKFSKVNELITFYMTVPHGTK